MKRKAKQQALAGLGCGPGLMSHVCLGHVQFCERDFAHTALGMCLLYAKSPSVWFKPQSCTMGPTVRSAACRVLTSSMAIVMGPTPPGTGVM